MEVSEIERLVQLVQNAEISELTLRSEHSRITIRKKSLLSPGETGGALVPVQTEYAQGGDEAVTIETRYAEPVPAEPETAPLTAPLVGVFRHVKPLIGLGARVTAGQIIGIIEAMNLINELPAPVNGIVTDVLVEDGMPVEYGHPLFLIRAEG